MSSSQYPAHTIASPASSLDSRLLELLRQLLELPHTLSDHPKIYPFAQFSLDPHDIEHYGSTQNALNHRLELIFGSRSVGRPIEFHGRGASLEAIVYVLHKYIDGEGGDNVPLWRWVTEVKDAAIQAAKSASEPAAKTASRSARSRPGGKRNAPKPRTKLSEAQITAAKQKTAIRDNPPDIEPGTGRVRDDLLDKLTIPCHSITDPSHKRSRCRGAGCGWSWADPRVVVRIIRHAIKCDGLDAGLRAEAKRRGAALSLSSKLRGPSMETETETTDRPIDSPGSTQKQVDVVNHALLKWICDRMVAPSAVDCPSWRELVSALNPNIKTASGSTIAENFVSTEAAYIRQSSVNKLSQYGLLTLSFDGGTTRKRESVCTVHVTTPETREAYLMEGNEASGVSHTAEHVCSVIDKVLKDIGPEQFASIVSDNARNTRAARALMEKEYPWIITLQDACHQLNNSAKDVGRLQYFQPCIARLQSLITYFHSSSNATRHLAALRSIHSVAEGLVAIGNTCFASYYYASIAMLKCLPLIRELKSSGVIELKSTSPIHWILDRSTAQIFEHELAQLAAVLKPFARSIKCLESSHSTLSDIYLFWLAVICRFQELFKANDLLAGVGLPQGVMGDITGILNRRHADKFQSPSGQVYLAAFFLDIRYRSSDVLARRSVLPLAEALNSQPSLSNSILLSDHDLRRSLPAYSLAGDYLVRLLARVYNKDPDAPLFARYADWSEIETAFRNQLILFTRGLSPFHRDPRPSTERSYWESMCSVPTAELLAHLGVILTSIVPNSMAEERSMSALTKMNSPDRACQKVSTLIDMITIRQHYRRQESRQGSSAQSLHPTVRFAEIESVVSSLNRSSKNTDVGMSNSESNLKWMEEDLVPEDLASEPPIAQGSSDHFEVEHTDGISLSSKFLAGLISDHPINQLKRSESVGPSLASVHPPRKRQRVDISTLAY